MRYYETTIQVTVLSEGEPFDSCNVETIAYAISEGDCVGNATITGVVQLSPKEMADKALCLGSDPGFFALTEAGAPTGD